MLRFRRKKRPPQEPAADEALPAAAPQPFTAFVRDLEAQLVAATSRAGSLRSRFETPVSLPGRGEVLAGPAAPTGTQADIAATASAENEGRSRIAQPSPGTEGSATAGHGGRVDGSQLPR